MTSWKKSALLTACFAMLLQPFYSPSAQGAAHSVGPPAIGTDLGDAVFSDIGAYVSSNDIPSINVDGYTAVFADDLRSSGFDVVWRPAERKVMLSPIPGKPLEPRTEQGRAGLVPGDKVADVLATDIEVFYGSEKIPSYNIEGRTALVLNDLGRFGDLVWNESQRKLTFDPTVTGAAPYTGEEPSLVLESSGFKEIGPITTKDNQLLLNGKPVGRINEDKQPMLFVRPFAELLGYSIHADNATGGMTLDDGTYRVELLPEDSKLYWMNEPAGTPSWTIKPVLENGDWLVHEQDVRLLFGCGPGPGWDWNKPPEALYCGNYTAKDYGLPITATSMQYEVDGAVYADPRETAYPSVEITNTYGGKPLYGSRIYNSEQTVPAEKFVKRITASETPLEWGDNHLSVVAKKGWKVLYQRELSLTSDPERMQAEIPYGGAIPHGDYAHIHIQEPLLAYNETDQDWFTVSGTVQQPFGDRIAFVVEKQQGDGWREVWEADRPMKAGEFSEKPGA